MDTVTLMGANPPQLSKLKDSFAIFGVIFSGRLIGRTTDFGSVNRGSNPFPKTIKKRKNEWCKSKSLDV
jgi:hypothetical protein